MCFVVWVLLAGFLNFDLLEYLSHLISFMLLLYLYDLMYIFWGEKEYLKLYSYLLLDYPVVVHLDLDTLVLKPMDDVFDIMTDPLYNRIKFKHHSMWKEEEGRNGLVDFVFTRDYNMVRFLAVETYLVIFRSMLHPFIR